MKLLIRHGRVIDPASGRDEVADVAIASGRIVGIGRAGDFERAGDDAAVIDALSGGRSRKSALVTTPHLESQSPCVSAWR